MPMTSATPTRRVLPAILLRTATSHDLRQLELALNDAQTLTPDAPQSATPTTTTTTETTSNV